MPRCYRLSLLAAAAAAAALARKALSGLHHGLLGAVALAGCSGQLGAAPPPSGAATTMQAAPEPPEPEATEQWEPKPPIVDTHSGIPADAIVLFDGSDLSAWELENPKAKPWKVEAGAMTVLPQKPSSGLRTKQAFGDVQFHIEFRTPTDTSGHTGQDRGNSGVFFMGQYELQVLDSYKNETYVNGQLGAIYKQYPPLVNPARKPGAWQAYDIVFIAPRFKPDGSLSAPARITAFLNGALVQYDSELRGPTEYRGWPRYKAHPEKLPLSLQDHQHLVSYRNIWVRELRGKEIHKRTIHPGLR